MSDTPRTDAEHQNSQLQDWVSIDFARTLERELNAFVRLALGDDVDLTQPGIAVEALAQLKNDIREAAGQAAALQGAKWGQEVVISQLRDEVARLRAGGCARDQRTTQFCAEAVELKRKLAEVEADRDSWAEQADQRAADAVEAMKKEEAWKAYAGRLEEAGNTMAVVLGLKAGYYCVEKWAKAKETKP